MPETPVIFELAPGATITVGTNSVSSVNLFDKAIPETDPWNVAIDVIETTLLALASEGVHLDTPPVRSAVKTAFDVISNKHGED